MNSSGFEPILTDSNAINSRSLDHLGISLFWMSCHKKIGPEQAETHPSKVYIEKETKTRIRL